MEPHDDRKKTLQICKAGVKFTPNSLKVKSLLIKVILELLQSNHEPSTYVWCKCGRLPPSLRYGGASQTPPWLISTPHGVEIADGGWSLPLRFGDASRKPPQLIVPRNIFLRNDCLFIFRKFYSGVSSYLWTTVWRFFGKRYSISRIE
jgi:hypothetical protein